MLRFSLLCYTRSLFYNISLEILRKNPVPYSLPMGQVEPCRVFRPNWEYLDPGVAVWKKLDASYNGARVLDSPL